MYTDRASVVWGIKKTTVMHKIDGLEHPERSKEIGRGLTVSATGKKKN